jgi:hypothetical protein
MKFNWGTGIALFYTTFVVVLVVIVFKTTSVDNSLVSDQYYADDLNYQQQYDKMANAAALTEDLSIRFRTAEERVEFVFPEGLKQASGEIFFFCPSDSKRDFKLAVSPDTNRTQVVNTGGLKPGLWRIKVNWKAGDTAYYKEEVITL